ncbi:MAG: aspartate aminotransferase [Candidatus Omnitrophica bacterium CG1_02_44_16]|nr:MAG: aspartate aminotransferase [Candidatus Omnitrophica bacterium CG1_02_44_16]PIY82797.1 MAG: aspartate aminotransferase [Candidatus Omnitrophica bacterium CG_4_10_14_0_8_um_filter_44_12]PIZ84044.1 MAG: aspartate aminotransferase [Candidatus Omnitrophica bacterium CG_4_10_14_0_2_um_filter_44_9]
MPLSKRVREASPSATLAITAAAKRMAKEGKAIIAFGAGEPDFDTPEPIKAAAIKAIQDGFTKYTPTSGIPELKDAICRKLKTDNNLDYTPSSVVVSCGAKHSLYNVLQVLVEDGDEVLIPVPFWVSYPEMVKLAGGKPVFVQASLSHGLKVNPKILKEYFSKKTKLLILNSPSNPCGVVYNRDELKSIAHFCVENGLYCISDEIYEKIIFDGIEHVSIASFSDEIKKLAIVVNGFSKSYSMTGWRLGYLAAEPEIASAVSNLQDHSTSNPNSITQKAALAAFNLGEPYFDEIKKKFQQRRDYIISRIDGIKQLGYYKPEGAFYIFCNIKKTGLDSFTFAKRLLEEQFVAVIPGAPFGCDDYIRVSFATSMEKIAKGFDRIEEWVNKIS